MMREVKKEELIQRCFSCANYNKDEYGDNESFCNICGEPVGNGLYYECYEPDDEDVEDDYASNMPCDTYGMCAGSSCSHYYQCQG